jgi:hypothetical protein
MGLEIVIGESGFRTVMGYRNWELQGMIGIKFCEGLSKSENDRTMLISHCDGSIK